MMWHSRLLSWWTWGYKLDCWEMQSPRTCFSFQMECLQDQLQSMSYDEDTTDRWIPIWGSKYTSRRFYSYAFSSAEAHPIFKIIWRSRCTPRIKFFAWLPLADRLNTKAMLQRRHLNIQGTPVCVMCNLGELETIEHLFFECPFAQDCWMRIGISWDSSLELYDRFTQARQSHNIPWFTEAVLIAAWELWKLCNDKVFQRCAPTPMRWLCNFKNQCNLQSVRFRDDL